MRLRRFIRRSLLAFESWRFRKRFPALRQAARAEAEASRCRNTQAIHRARQNKRRIVHEALKGICS